MRRPEVNSVLLRRTSGGPPGRAYSALAIEPFPDKPGKPCCFKAS